MHKNAPGILHDEGNCSDCRHEAADFYIPRNKRELVKYLKTRHPEWNVGVMKKAQLMAIYIKLRQKDG